jgi:hypothetical protein
VVEATSNWGYVYDVVEPWVAEIVLAHPLRVKAISSAKVKTDRIDGDTLAQGRHRQYCVLALHLVQP